MLRRTFLQMLGALASLPLWPRRGYGYVDVRRAEDLGIFPCRVWVDDQEVTMDCPAFHDREGWAEIFDRNAEGRHYYDASTDGAARRKIYGRIRVKPNSRLSGG